MSYDRERRGKSFVEKTESSKNEIMDSDKFAENTSIIGDPIGSFHIQQIHLNFSNGLLIAHQIDTHCL
jgi:hypothetical protein